MKLLGLFACGTLAASSGLDDEVALMQEPGGVLRQLKERMTGHSVEDEDKPAVGGREGLPDLEMVHVPSNFGTTIERDALRATKLNMMQAQRSFKVASKDKQWELIKGAVGDGGQIWGMMNPDMREISSVGCKMYYTPSQYWPENLAEKRMGRKALFGIIRDPYDRIVNEFRMQASGISSVFEGETREDVSKREKTSMDREGSLYKDWYDSCDVNQWIKRELRMYKHGDKFRGNCHLLPQSEYFSIPYGISIPVDARKLPESFNTVMEGHGYDVRMSNSPEMSKGIACDHITAWDLDEGSKEMVREVYARDFEQVCKSFGYCNNTELTCLSQIPNMCGEREEATQSVEQVKLPSVQSLAKSAAQFAERATSGEDKVKAAIVEGTMSRVEGVLDRLAGPGSDNGESAHAVRNLALDKGESAMNWMVDNLDRHKMAAKLHSAAGAAKHAASSAVEKLNEKKNAKATMERKEALKHADVVPKHKTATMLLQKDAGCAAITEVSACTAVADACCDWTEGGACVEVGC